MFVIIFIVAILILIYSKTVHRYILYYILRWISNKATENMSNGFANSNQYSEENQKQYNSEREEHKNNDPNAKKSVKDMMKKMLDDKKSSQYVDFEEIK